MKCAAYGITDVGRRRKENQDAFLISTNNGFFAVADGMGGMMAGGQASRYAINSLYKLVNENLGVENDIERTSLLIKDAIIKVSDWLREKMGKYSGTTIVSAFIKDENAVIAHMGDSRAYLLRNNELSRLTEDHNLFSLLSKTKRFTEEELRNDKTQYMLIRYMGMEYARPDIKVISLKRGDRLLLCTDGLSEMIKDGEIAEIMGKMQRLEAILQSFVTRANETGGDDNITAVIIECNEG